MILDDIVARRKLQLAGEKELVSEKEMRDRAAEVARTPKDMAAALSAGRLAVIGEVKKASPSRGVIAEDFEPVEVARQYEKAGVNAISVLTEEHYFKGSADYLRKIRAKVELPILRKDFMIDPYQLYESLVIGADAVLLIAALLDDDTIASFLHIADTLGLQCLIEAHNAEEMEAVVRSGCKLVGINNRNLQTFEVSLQTTEKLIGMVPEGRVVVSESGIRTNADMKAVAGYGASAVLVGETLMRSADVTGELMQLRMGV